MLPPCMPACQRAPDLITDGCGPPCGCWELNSGPWEEQPVLLTTEPSFQSWNRPWSVKINARAQQKDSIIVFPQTLFISMCQMQGIRHISICQAVVAHTFNLSTREAEAGGSL